MNSVGVAHLSIHRFPVSEMKMMNSIEQFTTRRRLDDFLINYCPRNGNVYARLTHSATIYGVDFG